MRYPDARLSQPAVRAAAVDDALRDIGARLLAAAKEARAYGLAAVHIGEVAPLIAVSPDGENHQLLFNPQVVALATEMERGEEGSVSLPGVRLEIDRPIWAEVTFQDAAGDETTARFDGFAARVVLHEIEQMHGVFFLDKVSRLKRDRALKKAQKLAR